MDLLEPALQWLLSLLQVKRTPYKLNSLDIGTQYYFQVQSRNRFGSVVSNVMDFTTE